jgi:hypothetical protein
MRLSAQRVACSAHESDADCACAQKPMAVTVDCFGDLVFMRLSPGSRLRCVAKFTAARKETPVATTAGQTKDRLSSGPST